MPTLSPLATLAATLAEVCQQAQQHQQLLSKNEAATRAALIDPVLRALGWDTADIKMVVPEFAVSNKQKPDYFLKTLTGATHIVIEAKKLGEDLDKMGHTGKLIGYAFTLKPLYHFVTDGLRWHCFSPKYSQYEPSERVVLTADGLLLAATQLLQLLDAAHAGHGLSSTPLVQSKVLLPSAPASSTKASKNKGDKFYSQQVLLSGEKPFTELASINTLMLPPGQKPTSLRLPDGSVKIIQTWKDILLEISRFLLIHKKNLPLPLPDKAGKKRFLFSIEKPAVGSSSPAVYQGKSIFIYTHYSATDCIANALYAEAQLPIEVRKMKAAVAF